MAISSYKRKTAPLLVALVAAMILSLMMPCMPVHAAYSLDAPVMVSAENSEKGIDVIWNAVPGAESYVVLRKTPTGNWTKKAVVTEPHWTDTDVSSGYSYQYSVRCSNADGTKYTSSRDPEGLTVICMRPRTPYLTMLENGFLVKWSSAKNAGMYILHRLSEDGMDTVVYAGEDTSYTDESLESGKTYTYAVQTQCESNGQVFSSVVSDIKVKTKQFLSAPIITSLTQKGYNVTVKWRKVPGAEYYTVLRKVNDGGWVKKAVVTTTSWKDTSSKTSGNRYTYAVRCSSEEGRPYVSARNDGMTHTYLKTPVIKDISNLHDGILLTMNGASVADSYSVFRSENGGGESLVATVFNDDHISTLTWLDENTEEGIAYTYRIESVKDGTSVSSASFEVVRTSPAQTMYIAVSSVMFYAEKDVLSETTLTLPYMTEVRYLDQISEHPTGSWHRIEYDGNIWYMWLETAGHKLTSEKSPFVYPAANDIERKLINKAMEIYGQDTVYRRNDSTGIPDENGLYGYDCSGLVSYILRGVMREYVPVYDFYAKVSDMDVLTTIYNKDLPGEFSAYAVSMDDLRPGDIIFFNLAEEAGDETDSPDQPNHVGMYLGNGEFIHSTHYNWGGNGVFIMPLDDQYIPAITSIKRFVPEEAVPANTEMYINGFSVNIRQYADPESNVIATPYGNTPVQVLFTNENWAYIEMENGMRGFVGTRYLSESTSYTNYEGRYLVDIKRTLYSEPTSDSPEKTSIIAGDNILYLGRFFESGFVVVKHNDRIWYLYEPDDISAYFTSDMEDYIASNSIEKQITSSVNMRSTPDASVSDNIIGLVRTGTVVREICSNNTWSYIYTDEYGYGFVSAGRLQDALQ